MASADEQAIRDVIQKWMKASASGDVETVLSLMTDDVVFMVPGKEPFGKDAFAQGARALAGTRIEGASKPVEIKVLGDWAYVRSQLNVKMTPAAGGETKARSGYVMSIFTRQRDGRWLLARDANLLT